MRFRARLSGGPPRRSHRFRGNMLGVRARRTTMAGRAIILDTDLGSDVDDALCLALALPTPVHRLRSVPHVTRDTRLRARISRRLLDLAGRPDVPVFAGLAAPRSGALDRFVWFGNEGDGILDPAAADDGVVPEEPATTAMARLLRAERDVELVAIGPLTNLAAVLETHPDVLPHIRRLTLMGGHLRPARIGDHTFAPGIDSNLCADPASSRLVLSAGLPLRLVPIEVTLQAWLETADVARLAATGHPLLAALARAVRRWTPMMQGGYRAKGASLAATNAAFLHDPLALAAVYDESFCRFEDLHVEPAIVDGVFRTLERPTASAATRPMRCATAVDAARFRDHVVTRLLTLADRCTLAGPAPALVPPRSAGVEGAHEPSPRGTRPVVSREPRPRLSIAAPCYNEAEGIEAVVAEWDAVLAGVAEPTEIVLCNDGSTDDTGAVLARLRSRHPRLRVVENAVNGGYGRALSSAIAATRGEWVATIDSDGQFDVADALALLADAERGGFDAVTGWRRGKKDAPLRVLADRGVNLLVRAMFGVRLRDTNCALKVVKGDVLRGLRIEARGYPTPTEICIRLAARGCRLHERGVTHRERPAGTSKLHPWRTAWGFLRFLVYLHRKLRLHRAGILSEP